MQKDLVIFEEHEIRRVYDEEKETWYFSVIDIIRVLTQQSDYQTARKYWNKLKERLKNEGSELVTNCHQLKMQASDGKMRDTHCADPETLLRIIQSVPSPKAEPIKLWLAKVGYERMQEMADPELSLDRARETWQKHGRSDKWIQQRTELSTRQIAETMEAKGMSENKVASKKGGGIAKKAKLELEQKTGKKVITEENYLPPKKQVKAKKKKELEEA
jgi:hypothetical protein